MVGRIDNPELAQAVLAFRGLTRAADLMRRSVAEDMGVDVSATLAMGHLEASGPLSAKQLAARVGLTASTVTALVDRLETAGTAERLPHPTDRRQTLVRLTPAGSAALETAWTWMRPAFERFDHEHLVEITRNLNEVAASIDKQIKAVKAARRHRAGT